MSMMMQEIISENYEYITDGTLDSSYEKVYDDAGNLISESYESDEIMWNDR